MNTMLVKRFLILFVISIFAFQHLRAQQPNDKFGKRSKAVIELIQGCLTKDPKSRIKVDEIIKSDWIKEQLSNE